MKSILKVSALAAVAALALSACAGAEADSTTGGSSGETRTLSFSGLRSADHSLSLAMQAWADEVEAKTNGELTFEFYWDSALCPALETVSCLSSGQTDVAQLASAFEPASFPVTRVSEVGFVDSDLAATTQAVNELAQNTPEIQEEFANLSMEHLFTLPLPPLVLATAEPLDDLSELNGKSIATNGYWPQILSPLGVSPVTIPQTEMYESVQRGVIDGMIITLDGAAEGSMHEAAPYYTAIGEHIGSNTVSLFAMNQNVFESLTDEQKQAVEDAGQTIAETWNADYKEPADAEACQSLKDGNASVTNVTMASGTEAWLEEVKNIIDSSWLDEAASNIDDPEALLQEQRELIAQYASEAGEEAVNPVQSCIESN